MTDKFTAPLEDLQAALVAGDEVEAALIEIATEHSVAPIALRNRAERHYGDLTTYGERHLAVSRKLAEDARERRAKEESWRVKHQLLLDNGHKMSFTDYVTSYRWLFEQPPSGVKQSLSSVDRTTPEAATEPKE